MLKIGLILLGFYTIAFNCYIAMSSYELKGDYDMFCAKRNFFAWLPTVASLLWWFITLMINLKFENKIAAFFITFFSLPVGVINSIHTSHSNCEIGKQNDKTETKRYHKEKNNETFGTAAAVGGTIYTAHHAKKKLKEFTNVDSWEEFK